MPEPKTPNNANFCRLEMFRFRAYNIGRSSAYASLTTPKEPTRMSGIRGLMHLNRSLELAMFKDVHWALVGEQENINARTKPIVNMMVKVTAVQIDHCSTLLVLRSTMRRWHERMESFVNPVLRRKATWLSQDACKGL